MTTTKKPLVRWSWHNSFLLFVAKNARKKAWNKRHWKKLPPVSSRSFITLEALWAAGLITSFSRTFPWKLERPNKKYPKQCRDGILQFLNHSVWFCWTLNFKKKGNTDWILVFARAKLCHTAESSRWICIFFNRWEGLLGHHSPFPCFHHLTLPQARHGRWCMASDYARITKQLNRAQKKSVGNLTVTFIQLPYNSVHFGGNSHLPPKKNSETCWNPSRSRKLVSQRGSLQKLQHLFAGVETSTQPRQDLAHMKTI